MEEQRQSGFINSYGVFSYEGFTSDSDAKYNINIQRLAELVNKNFGKKNGFRFAFVPLNLANPEAFVKQSQKFTSEDGRSSEYVSFLSAASKLGLNVATVLPTFNGALCNTPISAGLCHANYIVPQHLNFIRSLPYESLLTTVFGAKNNRHVKVNLTTSYLEKINEDDIADFLKDLSPRKQEPEKPEKEI